MKRIILFILLLMFSFSFGYAAASDADLGWSFDDADTSGTTLTDDSPGSNDGTLVNSPTTGVSGVLNEAYDLDGTNQYLTGMTSGGNQEIISVWFNPDVTITGAAGRTDLFGVTAGSTKLEFGPWTGSLTNEIVSLSSGGATNAWYWTTASQTQFTAGTWYHLYFEWDGTNYKLYIDGVDKGVGTKWNSPVIISSTLDFGRANGFYFNGQVDMLYLSDDDTITTASEMYNSGTGYWPWDTGGTAFFNLTARSTYDGDNIKNFKANITENLNAYSVATTNYTVVINESNDQSGNNQTWKTVTATYQDGAYNFSGSHVINSTWLPVTGAGARTVIMGFWTSDNTTAQDGALFSYGTKTGPQELTFRFDNARMRTQWSSGSLIGASYANPLTDQSGAFTYDGSNMSLYLNGAYDGSTTIALNTGSAYGARIGERIAGGSVLDNTLVKWVKVYDTALTPSEIATESTQQVTKWDDLIGYWPFEQVSNNQTLNITAYSETRFPSTITNRDTATNAIMNLTQAVVNFNASSIITGATVPGNFTLGNQTNINGVFFNLEAGTYSVQYSRPGYFTLNQSVTVLSLDNKTVTVTDVSNAAAQIKAQAAFTFVNLTDYIVNVSNLNYSYSKSYNVSGNAINVSLLKNTNFNFTISKNAYLDNLTTLNVTGNFSLVNYTALMSSTNTLYLYFKDEITEENLYNVTFDIISGIYATRFTADGLSYFNVTGLPSSTYEIRYAINDALYSPRSYFISIPLVTPADATFTLYLLNNTASNIFTRDVYDQNSQPMNGSLFELQRFYVNSTSWVAVERALIDSEGQTVFTAVPNTQAYRYRILTNFTPVKTSEAFYLIDSDGTLRVNVEGNLLEGFNEYYNFQASEITITNASYARVEYSDPSGTAENVCLRVVRRFAGEEAYNRTCSTGGGTLLSYVDPNAKGMYYIDVVGTFDGESFVIDNMAQRFDNLEFRANLGMVSYLILSILIIFFATVSFVQPVVGVGGLVLTFVAFSTAFLGFITLANLSMGGLLVVGIILLVLSERST